MFGGLNKSFGNCAQVNPCFDFQSIAPDVLQDLSTKRNPIKLVARLCLDKIKLPIDGCQ
jgi:hypothetical protein